MSFVPVKYQYERKEFNFWKSPFLRPKKDSARLCVRIQYEAYVFFEFGVQGIK